MRPRPPSFVVRPRTYARVGGPSRRSSVLEADHALHDASCVTVERRERQSFDVVLGVPTGAGSETCLELRQRGGGPGLSHVVVAATGVTGLLDRQLMEEVVGSRGT